MSCVLLPLAGITTSLREFLCFVLFCFELLREVSGGGKRECLAQEIVLSADLSACVLLYMVYAPYYFYQL